MNSVPVLLITGPRVLQLTPSNRKIRHVECLSRYNFDQFHEKIHCFNQHPREDCCLKEVADHGNSCAQSLLIETSNKKELNFSFVGDLNWIFTLRLIFHSPYFKRVTRGFIDRLRVANVFVFTNWWFG